MIGDGGNPIMFSATLTPSNTLAQFSNKNDKHYNGKRKLTDL